MNFSSTMKENHNDEVTLKGLREGVGLTQPELSQKIHCSVRSIASWESRSKIPRLDNAIALAVELNVSLKMLARSMGLDVSKLPDDVPLDQLNR